MFWSIKADVAHKVLWNISNMFLIYNILSRLRDWDKFSQYHMTVYRYVLSGTHDIFMYN